MGTSTSWSVEFGPASEQQAIAAAEIAGVARGRSVRIGHDVHVATGENDVERPGHWLIEGFSGGGLFEDNPPGQMLAWLREQGIGYDGSDGAAGGEWDGHRYEWRPGMEEPRERLLTEEGLAISLGRFKEVLSEAGVEDCPWNGEDPEALSAEQRALAAIHRELT